jgi:hypothetical protein
MRLPDRPDSSSSETLAKDQTDELVSLPQDLPRQERSFREELPPPALRLHRVSGRFEPHAAFLIDARNSDGL